MLGLVVPRKSVNPRLDQDETELGVFILAIDFQVFADGDRLFDEVPKVLRDGWAKSYPQTKGMIKYTRYDQVRTEMCVGTEIACEWTSG